MHPATAPVDRMLAIEPRSGDLVIGRRRGHDIELPFPAISEQHAHLSRNGQGWLIADLSSANGTYLNGRRLTPFAARTLAPGDVLGLADVEMVFEGEDCSTREQAGDLPPESTATLARRLVNDLFGARRPAEVARLMIVRGPAEGRELRLETIGRQYRVGRGADCSLVVPDADMSREHAEFERRWDGVFVRDLHSKNGVLLGGEALVDERRLSDGDELQMGQSTLRLDDPEDRYLRQMEESAAAAEPAGLGEGRVDDASVSATRTADRGPGGAQRLERLPLVGTRRSRDLAGRGLGPVRRGPLVLVIVAALVLIGAIGLALSFLLQS